LFRKLLNLGPDGFIHSGPAFHFPSGVMNSVAPAASTGEEGEIPFVVGSNLYREPPFVTIVQQLDGNSHESVVNITPGGFLRGLVAQVTSTGGVIGSGVLQQDNPTSIISSASLEDISGGPILYPMSGFAYAMCQKWLRPWDGPVEAHAGYSGASINPSFTIRFFVEVKNTLAVLANTDARSQYRFRFTLAPGTAAAGPYGVVNVAPTTLPIITVKLSIATWAQPDLNDLMQNPIQQIPDGLVASRFLMHEVPVTTAANNVIRETLTGNELRGIVMIFRNGNTLNTRYDLTDTNASTVKFRQDSRNLWQMVPSQWVEELDAFYSFLQGVILGTTGAIVRETGVYSIPRFAGATTGDEDGGQGEYWQQTVEQTLLQLEFGGGDLTTSPGTIEMIYDALAISGPVPGDMEGI
jgi:hypothetical protein